MGDDHTGHLNPSESEKERLDRELIELLNEVRVALPGVARAQAKPVQTRDALFDWDAEAKLLYLSIGFRDVIDPELQAKLSRGLPTTIVFTAAIYRGGNTAQPLSTTAHTCRVTWHVWEEAYRVEITRPRGSQVRWTTTVEGVLDILYELSGVRLQAAGIEVFRGHPMTTAPRGVGWMFYGMWPAVAAAVALARGRRQS